MIKGIIKTIFWLIVFAALMTFIFWVMEETNPIFDIGVGRTVAKYFNLIQNYIKVLIK